MLSETSLQQASALGETLRRKIENSTVSSPEGKIKVTISMGVSALENDNFDNYRELLIATDKALYKAKKTGKNRICMGEAGATV